MFLQRWFAQRRRHSESGDDLIEPNVTVSVPVKINPAAPVYQQLEEELELVRHKMHILSHQTHEEDIDYIDGRQASEFLNAAQDQTSGKEPDQVAVRQLQLRRAIYELEQQHEDFSKNQDSTKD